MQNLNNDNNKSQNVMLIIYICFLNTCVGIRKIFRSSITSSRITERHSIDWNSTTASRITPASRYG